MSVLLTKISCYSSVQEEGGGDYTHFIVCVPPPFSLHSDHQELWYILAGLKYQPLGAVMYRQTLAMSLAE